MRKKVYLDRDAAIAEIGHRIGGLQAADLLTAVRLAKVHGPISVGEAARVLLQPVKLLEHFAGQRRIVLGPAGTIDAAQVRMLAANLSAYRREERERAESALSVVLEMEKWAEE